MGLFHTEYIPRSVLPPRAITSRTIKPSTQKRTHCHNCGTPYIEGKDFCANCGAKRAIRQSLPMENKRIKAIELAPYLTNYLAENPYLCDVNLNGDVHFLANDFNRTSQVSISNIELTYCVADEIKNVQYGVEYVYSYHATTSFKKVLNCSSEDIVQKWQALNPDLHVVKWFGGRTTCTDNGTYQLYAMIVYCKNVAPINTAQIAAAPTQTPATTPTVKFCRHCGKSLSPGAFFCEQCGGKI